MGFELSIVIPSRREEFLGETVDDILKNSSDRTNVIIVLDGEWPVKPLEQHPRVTVVYLPKSIGQRAATNLGVRLSNSKYVAKCDAHVSLGKDFDSILIDNFIEGSIMLPTMYNLHVFDWVCRKGHRRYQSPSGPCKECGLPTEKDIVWKAKPSPETTAMRFDTDLKFQYWSEYKKKQKGDIVETMSILGAFWMAERDKYWEWSLSDEKHGSWGQQGTEISCKGWLGGNGVYVNKKTWYAHMFRTQGGDFGFPYPISGSDVDKARKYSRDLWLGGKWDKAKRPLSWLIDKFNPPDWTTGSKGILYYTDGELEESFAGKIREQIAKAEIPVTSVSLKPLNFGRSIHLPLKRSPETMVRQILAGLEAMTEDIVFMCFQGDTMIETEGGLCRIDEVEVGASVKTHMGRYRKVLNVFKTPYRQRSPLTEIRTMFSKVRSTPEHPFLVFNGDKGEWTPAELVKEGDMLMYPVDSHTDFLKFDIKLNSNGIYKGVKRHIDTIEVDQDIARFLGLYVAEGHFNGKNGIGFTFHNNEIEYQEFVRRVCWRIFGREAKLRVQWATQVLINIHELGPLFKDWFGPGATTKRIPDFVFSWNTKNKLAFMRGILQGDGSWHKKGEFFVGLSSASESLLKDFIRLGNETGVGWLNKIYSYPNNSSLSKRTDLASHMITLSKCGYTKMLDILNSIEIVDGYVGLPVIKTKRTKMSPMPTFRGGEKVWNGNNFVYNIEVEEDNSYIAQSCIVHNCEHDVLYDPSCFDFIPPKKDAYYYNTNVVRINAEEGYGVRVDDLRQLSGLCAWRETLITHYKERLRRIETEGKYDLKLGFEPGTHNRKERVDNLPSYTWKSKIAICDIRHPKCLTASRWRKEQFRNQKYTKGWEEVTELEGWGNIKELVKSLNL